MGYKRTNRPRGAPQRSLTNPTTGETLTIMQWHRKLGISHSMLYIRLNRFGPNDPRTYTYGTRQTQSQLQLSPFEEDFNSQGTRTELEQERNLSRIPGPGSWERENL